MIGKLAGALIGREIDRRRGESGVRGAVLGVVAAAGLKRLGPLGLAIGGAWAAKQAYDRHKAARG